MTGKLVVFEGIDRSGKETQSKLLTQYLRDHDNSVAYFSFPNYKSWSGRKIKEWLHNKDTLNQYSVNILYSLNRYEMKETLEQALRDYDYVILDRYFYSNWIYGSFMEEMPKAWLQALDMNLPQPDMVFLLCISGELSVQRRGSTADIHESDMVFLEKCNLEYQKLGCNLGWTMVDGNDLASIISWRICSIVNPRLLL